MTDDLGALKEKVATHDIRISENTRRIGDVEAALVTYQNMLVEMREIKIGVNHLTDQVTSLSKRMCAHEKAPADKWEKLKWGILMILVTAIFGLILSHVGLKP